MARTLPLPTALQELPFDPIVRHVMAMHQAGIDTSSFRDPSGFVFHRDGAVYRQVNADYREHYDQLMHSGLYQALVDSDLLLPHQEVDVGCALLPGLAYKVIKPELVPFISYPYEWSFSQLRDAARVTLEIQLKSLEFGLSLKDCSAYNIQFLRDSPIHIDTLSFERYHEGRPWVAYRQFCQHFLAPLALMSYTDVRLSQLLRVYIDGVPLDLASRLLPRPSWFRPALLLHIHLHARAQRRFAGSSLVKNTERKIGRTSLLGLVESLASAIARLTWSAKGTEWAEYGETTSYTAGAAEHKQGLVADFLDRIEPVPKMVWDLGANTGIFSRIAGERGIQAISMDLDPAAVEKNYLECQRTGAGNVLPLLVDLTNPTPALGWTNRERRSLLERGPVDGVLALALIHHLAISNNLPFGRIAEFLSKVCKWLIIEFVPKSDPQVQKLLASRQDIFTHYTQEDFETEFARFFPNQYAVQVKDSQRILYLMERAT